MGFPYKADERAEPGAGWTPAELNHILQAYVVDGAVTTFGCVDWESDLWSCGGAACVPDVIHLIFQNIAFTDSTLK